MNIASTGVVVAALENRPVLLPGLDVYFQAYHDLLFDRPIGMSVGPLPWSSLIKWCDLYGFNDINDIETFVRYIRAMEATDYELTEKKKGQK